MKIINAIRGKMSYWALALCAFLASTAFSFAEGESVSDVNQVLTGIKTDITSAATTAHPLLKDVILAGVGLWIVIVLVGLLKRGFGAGKGR